MCVCVTDGLSAPVNVQVRRISSAVLEVSWHAPANHHRELVAGYRIYYHTSPTSTSPGLGGESATESRWDVKDVGGPLRVTQLTGLMPNTRYTVRVRARGVDGMFGNFSEAVILEEDISRHAGLVIRCFFLDFFSVVILKHTMVLDVIFSVLQLFLYNVNVYL